MTTLAELVAAERKRQGLSLSEVAARSRRTPRSKPILIKTTIHAVETGKRQSVRDETLDGFALALGIPIDTLRAAAQLGLPDTTEPFVLPRRASRLSRKERQIVLGMVDALLEAKKR